MPAFFEKSFETVHWIRRKAFNGKYSMYIIPLEIVGINYDWIDVNFTTVALPNYFYVTALLS